MDVKKINKRMTNSIPIQKVRNLFTLVFQCSGFLKILRQRKHMTHVLFIQQGLQPYQQIREHFRMDSSLDLLAMNSYFSIGN